MAVLKFIGCAMAVALLVYGKYWQLRRINDQRDQKSGVQTLFDGEK